MTIGHHTLMELTPGGGPEGPDDESEGRFVVGLFTGPRTYLSPWIVEGRYESGQRGLILLSMRISSPKGQAINSTTISGISTSEIQRLINRELHPRPGSSA